MKPIIGRELPNHLKIVKYERTDPHPEIPFSEPAPKFFTLENIISILAVIAAFLVGAFHDLLS